MSEETEAVECVACQLQLPVINDVLLTQPETVDEHAGRVEFASESDDPLKLSRENSHVFEEFFDERGMLTTLVVGNETDTRALWLGCSAGAVPRMMNRFYQQVVVVEPSWDRAQRLSRLLKPGSDSGLQILHGQEISKLPVGQDSFDLVIVDSASFPHQQLKALTFWQQINGLLRDAGRCYVLAQNPAWLARFTLSESPHLPISPLTLSQYRKMLSGGGLGVVDVLGLNPTCRNPVTALDVGAHKYHRKLQWLYPHRASTWRQRLKTKLAGMSAFTPAFSIIGRKGSPTTHKPSYLEQIIAETQQMLGESQPLLPRRVETRRSGRIVAIAERHAQEPRLIVVKMPFRTQAEETDARNAQALKVIHGDDRISSRLKRIIPRPLASGEVGKQQFYVETAHGYGMPDVTDQSIVTNAFGEALLEFHASTARYVPIDEAQLHKVTGSLAAIRKHIDGNSSHLCDNLTEKVTADLLGAEMPLVWTHGDAGTGNVFCGGQGEIQSIFDWETFDTAGFPLHDWVTLVVSYRLMQDKSRGWKSLELVCDGKIVEFFSPLPIEQYFKELKVPAETISSLVVAAWAVYVAHRLRNRGNDPEWLKRTVYEVLLLFDRRLGK